MKNNVLSPFVSESSFLLPDNIVESAWIEHAPFAFWLLEAVAPRKFVELGAHNGYSYFAVCQIVSQAGLSTSCYAIDTWQGDEHAGFYPEAVYKRVEALNQKYSAFSKLIRARFDQAVETFADGSIDLLHIDGRHYYEDAKEDFETWRPKLSDRGIVLFHDTNVYENNFGVFRLFAELKESYPTFEFLHGHGLGVLAIGEIPSKLKPLLASDEQTIQSVRATYSRLGSNIARLRLAQTATEEAEKRNKLLDGERQRALLEIQKARHAFEFERRRLERAAASSTHSRAALAEWIDGHENLLRFLSQQKRVLPTAELPAQLRRLNPFASRDAAHADLVDGFKTLASSLLFDPEWYLTKYPDVAAKGENPVYHYLQYGGTYPMSPGPYFDAYWYLEYNPDVKEKKLNPLLHFIREGAMKRRPVGFDPAIAIALETGDAIDSNYDRWIRDCDTRSDDDRKAIRLHISRFQRSPLISIVMLGSRDVTIASFKGAIDSIINQIYSKWEICIAVLHPRDKQEVDVLSALAADDRIKIARISPDDHAISPFQSALALANGDLVSLMDHNGSLAEHALYEIAHEFDQHPDLDLIYSDEDKIDLMGRRSAPDFKTDWNRELLFCQNMAPSLSVYRRSLLEKVGGLQASFGDAQGYDLLLRAADATSPDKIRHIPAVLHHSRREAGDISTSEHQDTARAEAGRRAVQASLDRGAIRARVEPHQENPMWNRIRYALPSEPPLVSLIVPTKNMGEMTARCVDGLLNRTDYPNIEVIVVDHESTEDAALAFFESLRKDQRAHVVPYVGPFNYSAINNSAVRHAKGSLIGLVNNDIDVIDSHWLSEMVTHALSPGAGAVGARLLYSDGSVQHCGVLVGVGGVAGHFCKHLERRDFGYGGRAVLASAVSAVTAACLIVKKSIFEEVGGLEEGLAVAFNDVDLCLKIRAQGYRNIFTPFAELFHHESISRGSDDRPERIEKFRAEMEYIKRKWKFELPRDPYFNPNLSLDSEDFLLSFPSRRWKPWVDFIQ